MTHQNPSTPLPPTHPLTHTHTLYPPSQHLSATHTHWLRLPLCLSLHSPFLSSPVGLGALTSTGVLPLFIPPALSLSIHHVCLSIFFCFTFCCLNPILSNWQGTPNGNIPITTVDLFKGKYTGNETTHKQRRAANRHITFEIQLMMQRKGQRNILLDCFTSLKKYVSFPKQQM